MTTGRHAALRGGRGAGRPEARLGAGLPLAGPPPTGSSTDRGPAATATGRSPGSPRSEVLVDEHRERPVTVERLDRAVDAGGQGAALGQDRAEVLGCPGVELADDRGSVELDVRDEGRGRQVDDDGVDLLVA